MRFVQQSVPHSEGERMEDSNMKKLTGLTSEPPLTCQSSDLERERLGTGFPTMRISEEGPPTTEEISLRKKCFKDFPGIFEEDGLLEDQEVPIEGA